MDEFDLIRRYFAPLATGEGAFGLADDVAELIAPVSGRLIVTTDAIVENVHFLSGDPLDTVAGKLVRVNVSDILAKGGTPVSALFTLVWPKDRRNEDLARLARGLAADLEAFGISLLGGDTTSTDGPLMLSLTLIGECGPQGPIRRSGAQAGDDVWVTGVIGDAMLGLKASKGELKARIPPERVADLIDAYLTPQPPSLAFAGVIAAHASASADISDGLVADAGHIAEASGATLRLRLAQTPVSAAARAWMDAKADVPEQECRLRLATGGDDYQALFCAARSQRDLIRTGARDAGVTATLIGEVIEGAGAALIVGEDGRTIDVPLSGWCHFRQERTP